MELSHLLSVSGYLQKLKTPRSVGARDFSPDWEHRYFGTEVPCPDNATFQFGEFLEVSHFVFLLQSIAFIFEIE